MADLSTITLPNGNIYNFKDSQARTSAAAAAEKPAIYTGTSTEFEAQISSLNIGDCFFIVSEDVVVENVDGDNLEYGTTS